MKFSSIVLGVLIFSLLAHDSYALSPKAVVEAIFDIGKSFVRSNSDDVAKRVARWPKTQDTVAGKVVFRSSQIKGLVGEHLTAKRLTGMGFQKCKSKHNSLHGIDGIYIKKSGENIDEIVITESKVDTSSLTKGQMSDDYVVDRCNKLLKTNDPESIDTANLVLRVMKEEPKSLQKQLWRHELKTGTTKVYKLDESGKPHSEVYRWRDNMIKNSLQSKINTGMLPVLE